ncbi:MAG: 1-deoxy-D-xylulose-5-phosphate reductoisomerase [Candidatus Krumholzibacteria bacterium]|nr:1-deoxy-D-xylulose-5-phosphate reductoisomerase [Candidatus Krumholzibacteria bacterium]
MMKRIVILGSTGSIGKSALEILKGARGEFAVVGLAAGNNTEELSRQLELFPEARFSMRSSSSIDALVRQDVSLRERAFGYGSEGLDAMLRETKPDLVINALVGISGLVPTVTALELGCMVALANKETLVAGGEIVSRLVSGDHGDLIPIDSEHFSISRCLRGYRDDTVEIILTASGGPFYGKSPTQLTGVTVAQVLDHPTWKMGPKVTVDSSNLLNKGLEVIEAHWLFHFPYEAIGVVIHPQSIVHSIVRLRDGSLIAHLGPADMKLPLMSALYYPEIREFPWSKLGLGDFGTLEFAPIDRGNFPGFALALAAAERGGTAPAVLNAADEIAVEAFLAGRIDYLSIVSWIEEALGAHAPGAVRSIEDVLAADRWTRDFLARRHREASAK